MPVSRSASDMTSPLVFTGATIITGFALTLFIGVAVSMFTAYTVTRTFLRLVLSSTHIHNTWWLGTTRPASSASAAD